MQTKELLACVQRATESMSTQIQLLNKAIEPEDIQAYSSALDSYAKATAKLTKRLVHECKSALLEIGQ